MRAFSISAPHDDTFFHLIQFNLSSFSSFVYSFIVSFMLIYTATFFMYSRLLLPRQIRNWVRIIEWDEQKPKCVSKWKWGWFGDFNWPYRNDADINISFNDVFALNRIISSFLWSLHDCSNAAHSKFIHNTQSRSPCWIHWRLSQVSWCSKVWNFKFYSRLCELEYLRFLRQEKLPDDVTNNVKE